MPISVTGKGDEKMSWLAAIPGALGLITSFLGGGKGEEIEYTPQISPEEEQRRNMYQKFIMSKMGQPATPYGGPLTAPVDPGMLQAMNMMSQYYYGQPYQMPQFGTMQDYMPQPQAQAPTTPKPASPQPQRQPPSGILRA